MKYFYKTGIVSLFLIFWNWHGTFAQSPSAVYVHTSNTCNIVANATRLDHPDLNGKPTAHIQVTPVYAAVTNGQTRQVGVLYDGSYWYIVNEDESNMLQGLSFNVLVVNESLPAGTIVKKIIHQISGNSGTSTIEDNTINNSLNNKLFVTNLRSRPNGGEVANNKRTQVQWHYTLGKFVLNNDVWGTNGAYVPFTVNARFNLVALGNNNNNIRSAFANLGIKGGASDVVFVQRTDGSEFDPHSLSAPLSVRYNSASGEWFVYEGNQIASGHRKVNIAIFSVTRAGIVASTPGLPREVNVQPNAQNQLTLSWLASTGSVERYQVEISLQSNFSTLAQGIVDKNATQLSHTFTGLNPSTTYYVRVKAIYFNCGSSFASTNAKTLDPPLSIPPAPDNLTATATSATQIQLTWNDVAGETAYAVERSTNGTNFTKVGDDLPANTVTFTNTGLTANTKYYYRVYAKNAAGNSPYSKIVETTTQQVVPAAPANLVATATSSSQIQLVWNDVSNETAFVVERSTNGTTFTKLGDDLPANTTTFTNSGLSEFTRYYYRVYAKNSVGNSVYSNVADATTFATIPVAPTNILATAVSSSEINITWNDNSNETAYSIERSTNGTTFTKIGSDLPANTTSYADKALQPMTQYYYRIQAKNSIGTSPYSAIASATTRNAVPPTPTGLSLVVISSSSLRLNWTDVTRETAYVIERSENGTNFTKVGNDLPANTVTFTDNSLHANSRYHYRIYAKNEIGNSSYSNIVSATTQNIDANATKPGSLQILSSVLTSQALQWVDNSSNELGFEISRSFGDSTKFVPIDSVGANITTYTSESLRPGSLYYYKVRAYFRGAVSNYSNIASEITDIINSSEPSLAVSVYPNPSSDYINMKNPTKGKVIQCSIYDVSGKMHLQTTNTERISIRQLPSGRYIVKVLTDIQHFNIPLIKY